MNKPMPPGFPLKPCDADGNDIVPGDKVKIEVIPNWLIHDLSEEELTNLKRYEGEILPICEFDPYGYAWFDVDGTGPFICLRPEEVRLVSEEE